MAADSPSGWAFRVDKLPIGNSRCLPIGHSRHKARSKRSIDENNVTFSLVSLAVFVGPWLPSAGPAMAGTAGRTPSPCHRPPDNEPVAGSGGPNVPRRAVRAPRGEAA